eukprot:2671136-Rhodomonas_salina.4
MSRVEQQTACQLLPPFPSSSATPALPSPRPRWIVSARVMRCLCRYCPTVMRGTDAARVWLRARRGTGLTSRVVAAGGGDNGGDGRREVREPPQHPQASLGLQLGHGQRAHADGAPGGDTPIINTKAFSELPGQTP